MFIDTFILQLIKMHSLREARRRGGDFHWLARTVLGALPNLTPLSSWRTLRNCVPVDDAGFWIFCQFNSVKQLKWEMSWWFIGKLWYQILWKKRCKGWNRAEKQLTEPLIYLSVSNDNNTVSVYFMMYFRHQTLWNAPRCSWVREWDVQSVCSVLLWKNPDNQSTFCMFKWALKYFGLWII